MESIHYWREIPHPTLPAVPLPTLHSNNYTVKETRGSNSRKMTGFVDSDWATNTKKRTSMTGMVIMHAEGLLAINQNARQSLPTHQRKQNF
jgi:hypothetical protein